MNKLRFSQRIGSQFDLKRGDEARLDSDALKIEVQKSETNKLWTVDITNKLQKQVKASRVADEDTKKVVQALVGFSSKCSRFAEYSPLSMMLTKMSDMMVEQSNHHFNLNKRLTDQVISPLQSFVQDDMKNAKAARKKYEKVRSAYNGILASASGQNDPSMEDSKKDFDAAAAEVQGALSECNAALQIYMLKAMLNVYEANLEFFKTGYEWLESNRDIFDEMKKRLVEETKKLAHLRSQPRQAKAVDPRVFGVPLNQLLAKEGNETGIPRFVGHTLDYVEQNCLELVGVFRISAAKQLLLDVKGEVDKGMVYPEFQKHKDAHVAPALLKEYLRDMPEPLLTFEMHHKFINANKVSDPKDRLESLRQGVWSLPKANRFFLKRLLGLLKRISDNQTKNKMGATNLATVVGPNILYAKESNPATIVEDMQVANEVITTLISEFRVIFEERSIVEAIFDGNLQSVERFVAEGQDLAQPFINGKTALHLAVDQANVEIVKFLLGKRAPLDAMDSEGRTHVTPSKPALLACRGTSMHQGVLLLLAREGADLEVKDNHGHTIWELAKNIAPDGKLAQGIIDARDQYRELKAAQDSIDAEKQAEELEAEEQRRKEEEAARIQREKEEEEERLRTEEVVLEEIHSLHSLVKEDVALHSMYKLLNLNDVMDSVMFLAEACVNDFDQGLLTKGLKGCVASVKQLFAAVPQFVRLFSEKPKQLIVQNTTLLQDGVRALIASIQNVVKNKGNKAMEEEAVINVRELLDTLHKLFRACEVAGFDYTRQVMGDTVQSVGALVHKAASEPQESVDKQITVVATNSLKLVEARQLKLPDQALRDDISAQILVLDSLLLDVINESRLHTVRRLRKQEPDGEELKNSAKVAVSELQQLLEMMGGDAVEEPLDEDAQCEILLETRKALYDCAVPLQDVGLTKLDQAIVIQLQTLVNTLGELGNEWKSTSKTDMFANMKKVIDAYNKIRIGLNQMAPDQRDFMFRRKLRVFVEVLTYAGHALKVGTMVRATDSALKSEIQVPITVRDASICCSEFFEDLLQMRQT